MTSVWWKGLKDSNSSGIGSVRPCTIAPGCSSATASPACSHSGAARQSSSVKATSGARAARQPSLRATAGPRERARWMTRTSRSPRAAAASSAARVAPSSSEASSTTTTSKASRGSVCSRSDASMASSRSARLCVAITTETLGSTAANPSAGARLRSRAMSRADSPLAGRMIFNVGARRSGTLWLQRVVTAHPDVAAVPSETHLFSHGIAPLFERFQHGAMGSTEVGRVYVERDAIVDAVRDLCDTVFAPMLGGRARLAERTPVHALHVALIAEVYPDAQVVHIIRDGRDVARSIVAQRWGPDGVADAACEWRLAVETARAGAPAGRYVEVRYEDLHADPDRELRRLYGELGLAIDDAIMRAALAEAAIERNLDPAQSPVGSGKW